jgi:hypothetical protein
VRDGRPVSFGQTRTATINQSQKNREEANMKVWLATTLATSLVLAGVAVWQSRSTSHAVQQQATQQSAQIDALQRQLEAMANVKSLLNAANESFARPQDVKTQRTNASQDSAVRDDRLQMQRRANDNQWQEIDYLKSQRLLHKRLIDQINTEIVRLNRESREAGQKIRQLERGNPATDESDYAQLKQRVEIIYDRVFQRR